MNIEDWIVMGGIIILFGGLMVARHFINNIPTDRPHSLPMATSKVDTGNTEEERPDPLTDRPVVLAEYLAATEDASAQEWMDYRSLVPVIRETLAVGDRRIAELEQRHENMVQNYENLIATFSVAPARLADLEQRHERMLEHYESLIATFKEREATIENRLRDLEEHVSIMLTGFRD